MAERIEVAARAAYERWRLETSSGLTGWEWAPIHIKAMWRNIARAMLAALEGLPNGRP